MKAVIPVAGIGKRLRPLTNTQPKPLIPIAGKPILGFIIERLLQAGIDEFVFVVGYMGSQIQAFVKDSYPDLVATFVEQSERKGIGHAIWKAKDAVGNDPMFIVLGDTVFEADIESVLESGRSALGIKRVDDPRDFGVASIDSDKMVTMVVEKPAIPKSNLALVGLYLIRESEQLFDVLGQHIKNDKKTHNEFQLTDAINKMIGAGTTFGAFKVDQWFDCGKRTSLLETNATLLRKNAHFSEELPAYTNSIIIHPVSIAAGCELENAIIGPNVTIGEKTNVKSSIVRNSIIGSYSTIDDVLLQDSVIGTEARISGAHQTLNIGDNTEIDLG